MREKEEEEHCRHREKEKQWLFEFDNEADGMEELREVHYYSSMWGKQQEERVEAGEGVMAYDSEGRSQETKVE